MNTIIIAAGMGSRLWPITQRMPKTLLPFGETTILANILSNFCAIGVQRFTVVVGFRGDLIRGYLESNRNFGYDISIVENPAWERGNGLSVAAARGAVAGEAPVFLSMSDHLVHPDGLRELAAYPGDSNLLLTDPRPDDIYDIDDATKVLSEGGFIRGIGKQIDEYNRIDSGIFRITPRFIAALDEAVSQGEESISAGVRRLIEGDDMRTVDHPAGSSWIDIDTPSSYRHAIEHRTRYVAPGLHSIPGGSPPSP